MIRHLFIYFPPSCLNNRHIGLSEVRQLPSTQGIAHSDRIVSIHKHYFNVDSLTVNSASTLLVRKSWPGLALALCWRREARLGRLDLIFCKQIKICTIRGSCSEPAALAQLVDSTEHMWGQIFWFRSLKKPHTGSPLNTVPSRLVASLHHTWTVGVLVQMASSEYWESLSRICLNLYSWLITTKLLYCWKACLNLDDWWTYN